MSWFFLTPLLTSASAAALKFGAGKEISWFWVLLPIIGLGVTLVGVLFIAGLQALPGILGKLQMPITFLAIPVTTLATIVKLARVSL